MIKILIAVALLCAAVFLGPRLADSQGFVHIATDNYIIETSLTTAIILALVAFVVLHIVVNLLNRSIKLPRSTSNWFARRRNKKQQAILGEAFLAYEEGAYQRALGLVRKYGAKGTLPASLLFLGAKSSFKLGDLVGCRNYLDQAEQTPSGSLLACRLLRAKLNLRLGNAQAALENLDQVKKDSYTNAITSKLLSECYEQEGEYDKLIGILPQLKKLKLLNDEEYQAALLKAIKAVVATSQDSNSLVGLINKLSRSERGDAELMTPIVTKLVALGDTVNAAKYTTSLLKHSAATPLLEAIATWREAVPAVLKELTRQEKQNSVGAQTNQPLLKALANLELKEGKLSEAKEHLQQAFTLGKSPELYLLAAELNERLAQYDEATKFFALAVRDQSFAPVPVEPETKDEEPKDEAKEEAEQPAESKEETEQKSA